MSNENLDETKASGEQAGAKAGEWNDADLESVAGGIIAIVGRRAPVPDDGRGSARLTPVPDDGRGITGEPVPDDVNYPADPKTPLPADFTGSMN